MDEIRRISYANEAICIWNPLDFMKSTGFQGLKSAEFHAWNPPNFMHEIWQISWNLVDFMKSNKFSWNPPNFMHEIHQISWNSLDFMKSARFHEIRRISCMKSAGFHEIRWISWNLPDFMKSAEFHAWNPPDFMYFPNEPRTNGPIFINKLVHLLWYLSFTLNTFNVNVTIHEIS